jgi:hypothetical protein
MSEEAINEEVTEDVQDTESQSEAVSEETAASLPEWLSGIQDERVANTAKRYATPEEFGKAHLELRRAYDEALKNSVPGEDATDEQLAAYRKRVGIPETADAYEIPRPEGYEFTENDRLMEKAWKDKFHRMNLPQEQAEEIALTYYEMMSQYANVNTELNDEFAANTEQALREEWGDGYQRNMNAANTGLRVFGSEDVEELRSITLSNGRPLMDHPTVIKTFARIGLRMVPDQVEQAMPGSDEANSIEERIKEITGLMYTDRDEFQRRQGELWDLNAKLEGTSAVVGRGG